MRLLSDKRRKARKPRKQPPAAQAVAKPKRARITDPKEAARRRSMRSGRLSRRTAQLTIGWSPGYYHYDSEPCANAAGEGPCEPAGDASLQHYDFLKSQVRAPLLGSVAINAEWFPFQEYVGARASFSQLSYSTNFEAEAPGGTGHCSSHFCGF